MWFFSSEKLETHYSNPSLYNFDNLGLYARQICFSNIDPFYYISDFLDFSNLLQAFWRNSRKQYRVFQWGIKQHLFVQSAGTHWVFVFADYWSSKHAGLDPCLPMFDNSSNKFYRNDQRKVLIIKKTYSWVPI
jgi:hypothetical protein